MGFLNISLPASSFPQSYTYIVNILLNTIAHPQSPNLFAFVHNYYYVLWILVNLAYLNKQFARPKY